MTRHWLESAYFAGVVVALLGEVVFIVLQVRVRWWDTPIGRNLMAKAVVLAGLLGLSLMMSLVRFPPAVYVGGVFVLGGVVWWRNWISWRLQRAGRG